MALTVYDNERIYGVSWMLYRLKELLLLEGWTVPASSDGTTYSPTGDAITTGTLFPATTATPGSIANANSWVRLQHPLASCELLIQHSNSNTADAWKIRYSKLGFNGGSPSATVAPTATDEVYVYGSSTTFTAIQTGTVGTHNIMLCHYLIGDVDEDYAFMMYGSGQGDTDLSVLFLFDRVTDMEDPTDDPTIIGFHGDGTFTLGLTGSVATGTFTPQTTGPRMYGFMSKYSAEETQMIAHSLAWLPIVSSNVPFTTGSNPYNADSDVYAFPLLWIRPGTVTSVPANVRIPVRGTIKGKSRFFHGASLAPKGRRTVTIGGQPYFIMKSTNGSISTGAGFWLVRWAAGVEPRW